MKLATIACGLFFLVGLLTGVWKWRGMRTSETHRAPVYVDIAHRASLMYSFASLVLIHFLRLSPYPEWLNLVATAGPLFFFAVAIATYVGLAWRKQEETPMKRASFVSGPGTLILAIVEIAGFTILFAGLWLR